MNKYYYEVLMPDVTSPTIVGRLNVNTCGVVKFNKLNEAAIENIKAICIAQTESNFPHCKHIGAQIKTLIKLDE